MKIIGFNLSKISGHRMKPMEESVQIAQNIDIKDVEKEKIPISANDIINLKFNFSITYSKDTAKIEFEGSLILMPEKDELKEFMKAWKDKKIPETERIHIFNFIMHKCNIKALNIADELGLPLHIPMPRLGPNQNQPQ